MEEEDDVLDEDEGGVDKDESEDRHESVSGEDRGFNKQPKAMEERVWRRGGEKNSESSSTFAIAAKLRRETLPFLWLLLEWKHERDTQRRRNSSNREPFACSESSP
jgi:hypothetical protein